MKNTFPIFQLAAYVACMAAIAIPIVALLDHEHYFLNYHALGPLLASYFVGILGILTARKKMEKKERYYFFFVTLSIFFWLWTLGMGELCKLGNDNLAIKWFRLGSVGPMLIPIHIYAFSTHFLDLNRPKMLIFGYVVSSSFATLSVFSSYFLVGVHYYIPWGYFPKWQIARALPYFAYFLTYMGMAQAEYLKAYRKITYQRVRNQIKYLFAAFSISYLGAIDFFPTFGYRVYPLGYITILGWWTVLAYAIFKHRLLDITVIIRKTLIYSVVMGSLVILYLVVVGFSAKLFEGFSGFQTVFSSALAAGLITFCFQPLRKRVQAFVDMKFFRQYVDREEKLYELSREVITHSTPEAMAQALMHVLQETLHPKSGALYLKSKDGAEFVPAVVWGQASKAEHLSDANPLATFFLDHKQPFVQEMMDEVGESLDTRRSPFNKRG